MRRTPFGMRELISRITVSASGRFTDPLKWTLLAGTHASSSSLTGHAGTPTPHLGTLPEARRHRPTDGASNLDCTDLDLVCAATRSRHGRRNARDYRLPEEPVSSVRHQRPRPSTILAGFVRHRRVSQAFVTAVVRELLAQSLPSLPAPQRGRGPAPRRSRRRATPPRPAPTSAVVDDDDHRPTGRG
jgi:hypothetical protein